MGDPAVSDTTTDKRGEQASDAPSLPGGECPRLLDPRDATRGGVNDPALPGQRGRESPLEINWPTWREMLPKYLGEWVTQQ